MNLRQLISTFDDKVDQSPWHDDDLDDVLAFEIAGDGRVLFCGFFDRGVVRSGGDFDFRSDFAVHLDGNFNLGFGDL